jgi:uncharacterized protein YbbK (DUF523 family)
MEKVLVSSCLLGEPVRYDGSAALSSHPVLSRWIAEGRVVPFCPEIAAGLPTPRAPMEIASGDGGAVLQGIARVVDPKGHTATEAFIAGAAETVALCQRHGIHVAVLKERSPSCGSHWIYDGTFTGRVVQGQGVVTAALRAAGISVYSEAQWDQAEFFLSNLE